jgi:hypothetical protein
MQGLIASTIRARIRLCTALAVASVALFALPAAASAFTQADVNAAIDKGLTFLDANQNSDGSWGTTDPGAETALVLASYGVKGYANLSAAQQTRVQNGLTYLLGTQLPDGSFNADGLKTYDTGTALIALSLLGDVPRSPATAIATAVGGGRIFLINSQNVPANGISCQSTGTDGSGLGGQSFCGGWDYTGPDTRSDESNTGFALTGLEVTGGVPASVAANNVGYQRNVQQLTSNPGGFTARNDGGGAYEPGISSGDFSSNANDTGSLIFGFGYDGVAGTDPAVQAAIQLGKDVFGTYETAGSKANRTMVYHAGMNEDGSCDPAVSGCDWAFGGDGGYHYSIFALVKGLSQYISPNLADPTNFFAQAADLLLVQQSTDGSWPADLRDDGSILGATSFAILALGKVGAPPDQHITASGTSVSATQGHSFTATVATFKDPDTTAVAGDYSATINWGDGHSSTGSISGSAGSFTVKGTHTYSKAGTFTITVKIIDTDNSANSATVKSTAKVASGVVKGTASLRGISLACVRGSFTARVTGKRISKVTFVLDGRQITSRTVHGGSLYTARIALSPGRHHLTVKVTFRKSSKTKARTFRRTVSGCVVVVPHFTA